MLADIMKNSHADVFGNSGLTMLKRLMMPVAGRGNVDVFPEFI